MRMHIEFNDALVIKVADIAGPRRCSAVGRANALVDRGDVASTNAITIEEIFRVVRLAEVVAADHLFDGLCMAPIGRSGGH